MQAPVSLTFLVTIVAPGVPRTRAASENDNGDRSGDYFGQHL